MMSGITPFDPRLEQLRTLLLGREIELSRHFSEVLAPALGSSVRRNPNTLIDILHPLIGPAIGKSIDATFQSFNESLKHSLTWRGLKWRWEAWRTGTTFAEVVLRHTL